MTQGTMQIQQPGVLSLIQDTGRFGQHSIGLTVGGPMDPFAFTWANRLCGNADNATAIEITIGGFAAQVTEPTQIAVTGAVTELKVNHATVPMWTTLSLQAGDIFKVGFATQGCRIYLAIAGGFQVAPQFGSTATVVREGVGGLQGRSLNKGDILAFHSHPMRPALQMPPRWQPDYDLQVPLHVVLGYQVNHFSAVAQAHFFSSVYTVSERMDRMGYRLTGPACRSNMTSMLSEGICHGAIQIPPDGQPIVLLNDRQTIGGYPKLGSMMARDTAKLAQLTQGCEVQFTRVTIEEAHAINAMDRYRSQAIRLLLI